MGQKVVAMISVHGGGGKAVVAILQSAISEKKIPYAGEVSLVLADLPSKSERCVIYVHGGDKSKEITTCLQGMCSDGILPSEVTAVHIPATVEDVKPPRILNPATPGFQYPAVSWPKLFSS